MGRLTAGAVIVAIVTASATASIPATDDAVLPAPPPALGLPVAALPQGTTNPSICVWRLAFRPPARLYYGCRSPDTLETFTAWIDLDREQLAGFAALAAAMAAGDGHDPVTLRLPPPAPVPQQPTLCDRYWLWATDEGDRAPGMTRARKLAQACGDEAANAATHDN